MNINTNEAYHIGKYLSLGIFEKGYRELSIQIGEGAEIGAKKHGRNYILYVKKNNKLDKKARVNSFNKNIELESLAELISEIIESSMYLSDTVLDMKKVPILKNPITVPEEVLTEDDEEDEYIPQNAHVPAPVNAADDLEIEDLDDLENIGDDDTALEGFESDNEIGSIEEETEPEDLPQEETAYEENEEITEEMPVQYEHTVIDGEECITLGEEIASEDNECDFTNEETANVTNDTVLVTTKHHTTISKQSYLLQVLGEDEDIQKKFLNMINRLISLDKGKVTELYIRGLMALMAEYSNDIERLAEDLDIDERDLILAVYENQFC